MSIKADIDFIEMIRRIKTNRAYATILRHMETIRLIQPHGESMWLIPLNESADILHEAAKHPTGEVAKGYAMTLGEVVRLLDRLGLVPEEPTNEQEQATAITKVLSIMEGHKSAIPVVTFDPAAVLAATKTDDTGSTNGEGI